MKEHLSVGTVLQGSAYRYTIRKILDQNSLGITYLATTEIEGPLGRIPMQVAIKEFFAKDLGSCSEDGTAHVLESFSANDTAYCAMEYLEGETAVGTEAGQGGAESKGPAAARVRPVRIKKPLPKSPKAAAEQHVDPKPEATPVAIPAPDPVSVSDPSPKAERQVEPTPETTLVASPAPDPAPVSDPSPKAEQQVEPKPEAVMAAEPTDKPIAKPRPVLRPVKRPKQMPNSAVETAPKPEIPVKQPEPVPVPDPTPEATPAAIPAPDPAPVSDPSSTAKPILPPTVPPVGPLSADSAPGPKDPAPKSPAPIPASRPKKSRMALWCIAAGVVIAGAIIAALLNLNVSQPGSGSSSDAVSCDSTLQSAVPETRSSAATAAEAAQYGTLTVTSSPAGAAIWLDGEHTGRTTPAVLEKVKAGSHFVFVRLKGYQDAVWEVSMEPSGRAVCDATLTKQDPQTAEEPASETESVVFRTNPSGAAVWLDGKNTGRKTPCEIDVAPGSHEVVFKLAGYEEGDLRFAVSKQGGNSCEYELVPKSDRPGMITVNSTPSGAAIWLDGKDTGLTTPGTLEEVAVGAHKIVLRLDGYEEGSKIVSMKAPERLFCTVNLTRKQSSDPLASVATTSLGNGWSKGKSGNKTIYTNGTVSFAMVAIAGGSFTMGATAEQGTDAEADERPAHSVTLSGFSLGETEVTQALWLAVMGTNPSRFQKNPQCPVEMVSYDDCKAFISKLNALTGEKFRLPTEAEWEFAARGGKHSRGYKYGGGNNLGSIAWSGQNSKLSTHPVKTKSPNELGLYDMSGNVWEWCNDRFGRYEEEDQTNPQGALSGPNRVYRGGAWNSQAINCRISYRIYEAPSHKENSIGFRLAR